MWRLSSDFVGLVAFGYFCCFVPFFFFFFWIERFCDLFCPAGLPLLKWQSFCISWCVTVICQSFANHSFVSVCGNEDTTGSCSLMKSSNLCGHPSSHGNWI